MELTNCSTTMLIDLFPSLLNAKLKDWQLPSCPYKLSLQVVPTSMSDTVSESAQSGGGELVQGVPPHLQSMFVKCNLYFYVCFKW